MKSNSSRYVYFFIVFVLLTLTVAACGSSDTEELEEAVEPTSTSTVEDTEDVSLDAQETEPESTNISEPPETQEPASPFVVVKSARINVRSGPGTDYPAIQMLDRDETAPVIGFNSEQTWVQIELPDGTLGWVGTSVVDIVNSDKISTVTNASPAPVATSGSVISTPSPTVAPQPTSPPTIAPQPTSPPTVTPQPTSPPVADCVATASVNDETPAQRQHVYVYGTLLCNGQPIAGAKMYVVWNYKSTTQTCEGVTDASGTAVCERSIGRAAKGYYVRLDITITHNNQSYYATTGFTPQ